MRLKYSWDDNLEPDPVGSAGDTGKVTYSLAHEGALTSVGRED